jgi:hypothetical protein
MRTSVKAAWAKFVVDLGREDFLSLVELHGYLHYGAGVDPDRVERCSHPLLAGLIGHVRHLLLSACLSRLLPVPTSASRGPETP